MDQVNFSNNFMFGNLIYFIAFLTKVISQAIMAIETDKNIDLFQVISNLAEKRLEIPIESEPLKFLIIWRFKYYNGIVDPFKTNLLFFYVI